MSLPQYPKYKNSGVAWLGDVPEHWPVHSLRHNLKTVFNGTTAEQIDEGNFTVPVTRIETISSGKIDIEKLGYINENDARDDHLLISGDILFSNINSLKMIGNCAQYYGDKTIYAGMNLLVLRPRDQINYIWLFWLIRSSLFRREIESRAKPAINQASIPQGSILSIQVTTPPAPEQATIAAFLDRETAKIDALITEQEKLITLLAEKRQATISHAVTKGLNPNAPMKNSGVAWLGDVPEHWPVHSLRHNLKTVFNGTTAEQIDEGNFTVPVTRIETISSGKIDIGKLGYINENDARDDHLLIIGDILFSNINSLKMIGNCAQYYGDKTIYAGMNLLVLRPRDQINYIWLFWLIRSSLFRREIESRAKPAINQASIPQSSILSIQVTTPPVTEQTTIAAFLDRETAKIDALTAEAKRGIGLLKERRAALISAAVTGKINVCNFV